ncbi:MAG: hypothetical protein C0418_05190 [Coriobacteriaceae bacterium]|nr:hypothetical protein [Coriobacteriaceae bacterium]
MDEEVGTMPCPACGAEIKSAARVCRFCGTSVAGGTSPAPAPEAQAQAVMPPPPPPPPPPATAVAVASGPPPADFVMRRGYGIGAGLNPTFHVESGSVTFSVGLLTPEGQRKRWLWLSPMLAMVVVMIALGALLLAQGDEPPDAMIAVFLGAFVLFLVGAVVGAIGAAANVKRNSCTHTTTFPVSAVANANVAFDWDTGCAMIILFSLIGVIIMLSLGKRVVKMTAPLQPEKGMKPYRFIARSSADARALVEVIALWRSMAPPNI